MKEDNSISFNIKKTDIMLSRIIIDGMNDFKKIPISFSQAKIIQYLVINRGKKIYQKDLECFIKMRRSTISGILNTMEKNGFIQRVGSKEDARSKEIILNELFLEKTKKICQRGKELEERLTKNISPDELNTFLKVLHKIQSNMIEMEDK